MNALQTKRLIWFVNCLLVIGVGTLVWLLYPLIAINPLPSQSEDMFPAAARAVEVVADGVVVGNFAAPSSPQSVELAGQSFRVVPFRGDVPTLAADEIGWLEGTIINYVFFLGEDDDLSFDSAETDTIVVQLDSTTTLSFTEITTDTFDTLDAIIQQQQPVVTLVLGGQFVRGAYESQE